MAGLRGSGMDYNSPQFIVVLTGGKYILLQTAIHCVLLDVDLLGEFQLVINLYLPHLIKIVGESFENKYQDIGGLLDAQSLHGPDLLFALLAEIGIVTIENFPFDIPIKGFFQSLFVLDIEPNREEGLHFLTAVRTAFAVELVR